MEYQLSKCMIVRFSIFNMHNLPTQFSEIWSGRTSVFRRRRGHDHVPGKVNTCTTCTLDLLLIRSLIWYYLPGPLELWLQSHYSQPDRWTRLLLLQGRLQSEGHGTRSRQGTDLQIFTHVLGIWYWIRYSLRIVFHSGTLRRALSYKSMH